MCYRPFSQYEYVDGRFVPGANAIMPSPPIGDERRRMLENASRRVTAFSTAAVNEDRQPWYKEVVELRKAASGYKCRGWGTDLVSPKMSEMYQKQIELYEQTRNRESLSALSLAISTPRPDQREYASSSADRVDNVKSQQPRQRPGTAPPTASHQPQTQNGHKPKPAERKAIKKPASKLI